MSSKGSATKCLALHVFLVLDRGSVLQCLSGECKVYDSVLQGWVMNIVLQCHPRSSRTRTRVVHSRGRAGVNCPLRHCVFQCPLGHYSPLSSAVLRSNVLQCLPGGSDLWCSPSVPRGKVLQCVIQCLPGGVSSSVLRCPLG